MTEHTLQDAPLTRPFDDGPPDPLTGVTATKGILPTTAQTTPQMTVQGAREALYSSLPSEAPIGVEEAKQALLDSVRPAEPPLSVIESKALLLSGQNKQAFLAKRKTEKELAQNKLPITGDPLNGIPYILLDNTQKALSVSIQRQRESDVLAQYNEQQARESKALLSNAQSDTGLGTVANVGLSLASGAVTTVAGIASTATKGLNLIGLSDEASGFINDGLNIITSTVADTVNPGNQQEAMADIAIEYQGIVDQVNNKEYFTAVGAALASVGRVTANNPAAISEFLANSLPQMYVLAKNAIIGVGALTSTGYDQAIIEFKQEFGREPDAGEKAIAGMLSLSSAGLDLVGARTILGLKDMVFQAQKLGVRVAQETIKNSDKVFQKALGVVAAVPKAALVEGTTEGTQNLLAQLAGVQDISKVDPEKIYTDYVIGAGVGGSLKAPAAATKGVSTAGTTARKVVHKAATKVADTLEKSGVGQVDAVVENAIKSNTPEVGIDSIINQKFSELDVDARRASLNKLKDLLSMNAVNIEDSEGTPEEKAVLQNQQDEYIKTVQEMSAAHSRLVAGGSVEEAISTITAEPIKAKGTDTEAYNAAEIKQTEDRIAAIDTVIKNTGSVLDLNIDQTNKILGSAPFKENASDINKQILEDHKKFLSDTAKLGDITEAKIDLPGVNDHTLVGSPDGKFKGIKQYTEEMVTAIALRDKDSATKLIKQLRKFRDSKIAKLTKKGNDPEFISVVSSEVAALKSAHAVLQNMIVSNFPSIKGAAPKSEAKPTTTPAAATATPAPKKDAGEATAKAQPKAEASPISEVVLDETTSVLDESIPKAKVKVDSDPNIVNISSTEYRDTLVQLAEHKFTPTYINEAGESILGNPVSANVYLLELDKRINNLARIYKECS